MSVTAGAPAPIQSGGRRAATSAVRSGLRALHGGDRVMLLLCAAAGVLGVATMLAVIYQVLDGAAPAISKLGLGFLGHEVWQPNFGRFGAATELYGTFICSALAMTIALPLGTAIAIYLAIIAPRSVRVIVGPLVEMLAAIPSVILGFWGLIVVAPFMVKTVEPALHSALGFIPLFGQPQSTGLSVFTAGVILSIMVLPIIASISRDLFLSVPRELTEGAEALGATRWEVIRGVVLPTTTSGVAAATVLGLGRALGEAIAVAEVIGAGNQIHANLFNSGFTLASRIALDFQDVVSKLHQQSLFYLATLLLIVGLVTNLLAQSIASRFERRSAAAR